MRRSGLFAIGLFLLALYLLREKEGVYQTAVSIFEAGSGAWEYMKSLYDDIFKKWGAMRGLDWKLLRAFATVESNLKETAVGDGGASLGLMQVQHWHWEANGLSREDMFDPDKNVQVGSGFIADLMRKYNGDLDSVIQAYNLGEPKFDKGYKSYAYLTKVMEEYQTLKAIDI